MAGAKIEKWRLPLCYFLSKKWKSHQKIMNFHMLFLYRKKLKIIKKWRIVILWNTNTGVPPYKWKFEIPKQGLPPCKNVKKKTQHKGPPLQWKYQSWKLIQGGHMCRYFKNGQFYKGGLVLKVRGKSKFQFFYKGVSLWFFNNVYTDNHPYFSRKV